jgi:hypothetical protein
VVVCLSVCFKASLSGSPPERGFSGEAELAA